MKGSCLCGALVFGIEGAVQGMGHCHCSMCRKGHGSAFSTYIQLEEAQLRVEKDDTLTRYQSSPEVERSFCGRCGSNFTFRHTALPGAIFVAAGVLDDDPGVRPEHHLFVTSKAPWVEIDDALDKHEGYPPIPGA